MTVLPIWPQDNNLISRFLLNSGQLPLVYWVIFLFAIIAALNALNLRYRFTTPEPVSRSNLYLYSSHSRRSSFIRESRLADSDSRQKAVVTQGVCPRFKSGRSTGEAELV